MNGSLCAETFWIDAGPGGPGGWACHTFPDGETFPALCLADECPDRAARCLDGEVLLVVEAH